MARERVTALERALLANRDERSPELEFRLAGVDVKVVFRHLSQTRLDKLQLTAQQWVEDERRRREKDGKEWRDADGTLDKAQKNRTDLLQLHAAMEDPDFPGQEICRLADLEDELDPDTHHFLAERYEQWKAGLSLNGVTAEDIDEFREAVKKNMDPVSLWRLFGFKIPLASAISSVFEQLETSPEDSSSPTSP